MNRFKTKLKKWVQERMLALNTPLLKQVENQFVYHIRAEHLKNCALNSTEQGISGEKYSNSEIVISLTTYGKRLEEVYLSVESILQQTLKANKIILWLGEELKNETLPIVLQKQQKRGLELRYCKDILSYKKLIPALKIFPSATIITVDDDHLYNFTLIEKLVNAYKKNQEFIYCTRMNRIELLSPDTFEKYSKWKSNHNSLDVSPLNFPTGCGGILYPPHCFNNEVLNEDVFMDICKHADDIWFKAMALLNNVQSRKIYINNENIEYNFQNRNVQDSALFRVNIKEGMNDIQLKAVFDKYNLYSKLTD